MKNMNTTFGLELKRLRKEKDISLRGLEKISGVKNANIALIESGRKTCGAIVARKLGAALGLNRDQLSTFIAVANTTVQPATGMLIVEALSGYGIHEGAVKNVMRGEATNIHHDLVVTLKDGRRYWVDLKTGSLD